MNPPPLELQTEATVQVLPQLGMDGGTVALVLIKQAFQVDLRQEVSRVDGAEVRLTDVPWDPKAPEKSSVRWPSDVCLSKPGTDVVVVGSAIAAKRVKVKSLDVFVRVGPVARTLKVHGLRVWSPGILGLSLTEPLPFDELPLRWEFAWGGFDASVPGSPLEEPRNPAGRGVQRDEKLLIHQPGPSIEDPLAPIRSSRGKYVPWGVGALGPHWAPRRSFVGTHDALWKKERMPLRPVDFDVRHNLVAPPGMVATPHLRGGELVELHNLNEHGALRFALPSLVFFVGAVLENQTVEHRPVLDTVLLEPNVRRFELTWRSAIPWPRPATSLQAIRVFEKERRA